MKLYCLFLTVACLCLFSEVDCFAQEITTSQNTDIIQNYIGDISKKSDKLSGKMDATTVSALQKYQEEEKKIIARVKSIDSSKAAEIIKNSEASYTSLLQSLKDKQTKVNQYIPLLDSLKTSLNFFQGNGNLTSSLGGLNGNLSSAMKSVNGLEDQFQKAAQVKQFLDQQRQYLTEKLQNIGIVKELKNLSKTTYYYSQQIKEYKETLKDPDKIQRKALDILSQTKQFQHFMQKNSMLASLFNLSVDEPGNPDYQASLAGLQTKAEVNKLIQNQLGNSGAEALQEARGNLQDAQGQLQMLKDKMNQLGKGESDGPMPDFKPNDQKTKTLLGRLIYSMDFQTNRSTGVTPVTTEIGLSIGYKINDNSVAGIGMSYNLGWGYNFQHIHISQQGMGLRSFFDYRIKNSLWASGGFEMNYSSVFSSMSQLRAFDAWQKSGLIGLSKKIPIKSNFLKTTNIQILWDFLSYYQIPVAQPFVFRIGYSIK